MKREQQENIDDQDALDTTLVPPSLLPLQDCTKHLLQEANKANNTLRQQKEKKKWVAEQQQQQQQEILGVVGFPPDTTLESRSRTFQHNPYVDVLPENPQEMLSTFLHQKKQEQERIREFRRQRFLASLSKMELMEQMQSASNPTSPEHLGSNNTNNNEMLSRCANTHSPVMMMMMPNMENNHNCGGMQQCHSCMDLAEAASLCPNSQVALMQQAYQSAMLSCSMQPQAAAQHEATPSSTYSSSSGSQLPHPVSSMFPQSAPTSPIYPMESASPMLMRNDPMPHHTTTTTSGTLTKVYQNGRPVPKMKQETTAVQQPKQQLAANATFGCSTSPMMAQHTSSGAFVPISPNSQAHQYAQQENLPSSSSQLELAELGGEPQGGSPIMVMSPTQQGSNPHQGSKASISKQTQAPLAPPQPHQSQGSSAKTNPEQAVNNNSTMKEKAGGKGASKPHPRNQSQAQGSPTSPASCHNGLWLHVQFRKHTEVFALPAAELHPHTPQQHAEEILMQLFRQQEATHKKEMSAAEEKSQEGKSSQDSAEAKVQEWIRKLFLPSSSPPLDEMKDILQEMSALFHGQHVIVDGDRGYDLGIVVKVGLHPQHPLTKAITGTTQHKTSIDADQDQEVEEGGGEISILPKENVDNAPATGSPSFSSAAVGFVRRLATSEEIITLDTHLQQEEERALSIANSLAVKLLPRKALTIEAATFQFDKQKLTLWYTSQDRVYFVPLLKALNQQYKCRIWMERLE